MLSYEKGLRIKFRSWLRKHRVCKAMLWSLRHLHLYKQPRIINIEEGILATLDWIRSGKLPNDFDVIIGIPRSGLMFANIIASRFGRPLSTPDSFLRGEVWFSHAHKMPTKYDRILLVEDGVRTGRVIRRAYASLKSRFPDAEIKIASLYVPRLSCKYVDYYYAIDKRINPQEWELLTSSSPYLGKLATDIDGVLCYDSPDPISALSVKNAKPYLIPQYKIDSIITSRSEEWRKETEVWLEKHNVKYHHLFMSNGSRSSIEHKAYYIEAIKAEWFWESSHAEAQALARLTKIPILCVETMSLIHG